MLPDANVTARAGGDRRGPGGGRGARVPVAALALLLAACATGGDGDEKLGDAPSGVLLITVDTLRADHLGCYGGPATPRIDRLASEGVRFLDASTVAPITLPAHTSLLTGVAPPVHGVRDNGAFRLGKTPPTLGEKLGEAGYETAAFVGAVVLDAAYGLDRGFSHYDDDIDVPLSISGSGASSFPDRPASEVIDRTLEWLRGRPEGSRFFAWVHLFDPHAPYQPPEPFRSRLGATYDGEIAYVDEQVGRLLDGLDRLGRGDDTLVVLTADHGEGLGEHGETTHGFFLYQSTVHVPLILRLPGQLPAGVEVPGAVGLLDIAPTILDLAGLPPLPAAEGSSLVGPARGEPLADRTLYLETYLPYFQMRWSGSRAIRSGDWMYIRGAGVELYDLSADPREELDLASERGAERDRLDGVLQSVAASLAASAGKAEEPQLDEASRARLRSLGYLSGGGGAPAGDLAALAAARPDTRDRIQLVDRLLEAAPSAIDRNETEGLRELERLAGEDPDNPRLLSILGKALLQHGETEGAIRRLQRAVELDPDDPHALGNLGAALLRAGRRDEAKAVIDRAAARPVTSPEQQRTQATLLIDAGEPARAETTLRAVLEEHPDDAAARKALGQALAAQKRWPEALQALEVYLARDPDSIDALVLAGTAAFQTQQDDLARRRLARALELAPENLAALLGMGLVLGDSGDDAGAAAVLSRAVAIAGDNPDVLTLYGVAAARSGDIASARRALEHSLQLNPDQPTARSILQQLSR